MPYIKAEEREFSFNKQPNKLNAGEKNYVITKIIHSWVRTNGLSYRTISEIASVVKELEHQTYKVLPSERAKLLYNQLYEFNTDIALTLAFQEFYRVVAGPYENQKMIDNGPVSEFDMPFYETIKAKVKIHSLGKESEIYSVDLGGS